MSTVYTGVLAELGPRIVGGDLGAGSVITLEWLQTEYGVSRTIAREVVQVLASMGLVESRRRTGIRVRPAADWDVFAPAVIRWQLAGPGRKALLHQFSQLRAAVEPQASALAASAAGEEQRADVVRLAEAMEESGAAGDLARFLDLDISFHRLLLEASGNVMFAALGDVVEEVLRGRTDHQLMPPEPKPEARRLHQMVADAVAAGDADVARAAMQAICAEVVSELHPGP
jgi:DNA-binding FadR family transcriptional regulator